eukprot:TRINITY_DN22958_c1_g1_i3.p2 TRINITY_DN22958_c1_g1~~TRINITY_DN22958_c1_g1_i3.p2  ORF type:complete len:121 (+),score=19.09 TRINITY_DN22958_c1_g1_i3:67-429(+)
MCESEKHASFLFVRAEGDAAAGPAKMKRVTLDDSSDESIDNNFVNGNGGWLPDLGAIGEGVWRLTKSEVVTSVLDKYSQCSICVRERSRNCAGKFRCTGRGVARGTPGERGGGDEGHMGR